MAGRPRDRELEDRLLAAAWTLLVEQGYQALSLSRVAARAGAHRTDVYRRWPGKPQLVSDTLAAHLPPLSDPDTGSLHSDLRAFLGDLAAAWSSPWVDGLVGWVVDLHREAGAEQAFRAMAIWRSEPLRHAIDRAVRRGEIGQPVDLVAVGNLLEGPLMHRRLFGRQDLRAEFLDAIAASAFYLLTTMEAAHA